MGELAQPLDADPDTSLPVDEPTEDHDESHSPEIAPKDDGST